MLNLRDDGTITIDFPEPTGVVTISTPRYGAFKRIRAERVRLADELNDAVAALPELAPPPDDGDQSDEAKAERVRLGPIYQARLREVEEMTAETLAKTWRFILLGDDSFAGLATPPPPGDSDEWPAEILIDAAETKQVAGIDKAGKPTITRVRTNETILDAVAKHWGKARYHSGPTTPNP